MTKSVYNLDGHKLLFHPERVTELLQGRDVHPVYAEISPTAQCNHHCLFCNFNYLGHSGVFPKGRMVPLVEELVGQGVKAVVFAGAGEPTLHPDTFPAVRRAHELGADVAMSTNGARLDMEKIEVMAQTMTWVRFSVSGGSARTHALVHRTSPEDFGRVLNNIAHMREAKEKSASSVTIGSQCVLIQENHLEIRDLALALKERGADYFVVKHFYPHQENAFDTDTSFRTPGYLAELEVMAHELTDTRFQCIVRDAGKLDRNRPYARCLGLPFLVYVREDGEAYTCFSHQHDPQTSLGNITQATFAELWTGPRKAAVFEHISKNIDKNSCQANCRHHQINLWLHGLTNPPAHVNFI